MVVAKVPSPQSRFRGGGRKEEGEAEGEAEARQLGPETEEGVGETDGGRGRFDNQVERVATKGPEEPEKEEDSKGE